MTIIILISILCILISILYYFLISSYDYFEKKKIPCDKPVLMFGNVRDLTLQKVSEHKFMLNYYLKYKNKTSLPFCGIYVWRKPFYFVLDFNLVKDICVRDFDHFMDRIQYDIKCVDLLKDNLLLSNSSIWKPIREMLTPAFTSGKLKAMDVLFQRCGERMSQHLLERKNIDQEIEMKHFFGVFTLDVTSSALFGIEFGKNLWKEVDNELISTLNDSEAYSPVTAIKLMLSYGLLSPQYFRQFIKVSVFNEKANYFAAKIIRNARECRLKSNQRRDDFLQLLLDISTKEEVAKPEYRLMDEDHIISQSILILLGGFSTTRTTLEFAAYELALNPEVQNTLRAEIKSVLKKHNNICNYVAIQDMHYLEMVLLETLRKHPPFLRFERCCVKDYKVRGVDMVIKKGTFLLFPVGGFHHDSRYFPNPEKFDPLRFQENRNPDGFLAFGMGQRSCIGQRYGMIVAKYALVYVLKDFEFTSSKKTQVPESKHGKVNILIKPKMMN